VVVYLDFVAKRQCHVGDDVADNEPDDDIHQSDFFQDPLQKVNYDSFVKTELLILVYTKLVFCQVSLKQRV